jgi:hypothetical protein
MHILKINANANKWELHPAVKRLQFFLLYLYKNARQYWKGSRAAGTSSLHPGAGGRPAPGAGREPAGKHSFSPEIKA